MRNNRPYHDSGVVLGHHNPVLSFAERGFQNLVGVPVQLHRRDKTKVESRPQLLVEVFLPFVL